ncbi:enoyl-CoA hydratase-related protein [Hyphomonas sp.]|uniref:enoyl-CoA hydratase/isomerase family protein n=1 Tax=Hyphomonas sp. TaxID=87 RepID=UPI0025C47B21|nr:enoyl-CoA hydratase-related protein [Hyphomonas sp.]
MTQTIRLEIAAPLAEIILDQPQRRNALSLEMWAALPRRVAEANADPHVKVILLHGGGGGVFAAGADISEFPVIYGSEAAARQTGATIARALAALEESPKPVIAAIEGACVGGGVSLAVASDIRVATATAGLGITPAKLGLVYPPGDMARLVRLVGLGAAKRLLFTGRIFSAGEALAMGLVDEIVDASCILPAARALGLDIAAQSQWSVRATKRMMRGFEAGFGPGSSEAEALFLEGFANPDFREGVSAFLGKRKPDWKVT